jgi:uncharacterized membrane protein YciS (DUF1049 family)
MKKLRYLFWLVFIAFFAVLGYQNRDYFSAKYSLHIDLGFYQRYTPDLANGVIIAGFVGIAVFIMLIYYFASRFGVYKANKTVKELKSSLDERTSVLADLKGELESLKSGAFSAHSTQEEPEKPPETSEQAEVSQPSQV